MPPKGVCDISLPLVQLQHECNGYTLSPFNPAFPSYRSPKKWVHPSFVPLMQFCSFWEMHPETGSRLPNERVETSTQTYVFGRLAEGTWRT